MTAMFNKFHGYTKIDNIIGPLKIGYISKQKSNFNVPQNENPIGEADEDENED